MATSAITIHLSQKDAGAALLGLRLCICAKLALLLSKLNVIGLVGEVCHICLL